MTRNFKSSRKDTFKCPECRDGFTRKADLARHVAIHSPDVNARKFPCPYNGCFYRNLQKSNLQTHITAVHLRERPHKCTQGDCKSAFADGAALNRHLKSQHGIFKRGTKKSRRVNNLTSSPEVPVADLHQETSTINIPDTPVDNSTPPDTGMTDSSSLSSMNTFESDSEFVAEMDDLFFHPDFQLDVKYHFLPTFFEECALLGLPMEQFMLGSAATGTTSFMQQSAEVDFGSLNKFRFAFGSNITLPYRPMPSGAATNKLQEDLCVGDFLMAFTPEYLPFVPDETIDPFSLTLL